MPRGLRGRERPAHRSWAGGFKERRKIHDILSLRRLPATVPGGSMPSD
jgi:hypothetical protein